MELTCVPVFSDSPGMPGMQAGFTTGDSNWAGTDIEAKLDTSVDQAERHKITTTFMLAVVHNQTWADIDNANCYYQRFLGSTPER